jgi:hypothetical protein
MNQSARSGAAASAVFRPAPAAHTLDYLREARGEQDGRYIGLVYGHRWPGGNEELVFRDRWTADRRAEDEGMSVTHDRQVPEYTEAEKLEGDCGAIRHGRCKGRRSYASNLYNYALDHE